MHGKIFKGIAAKMRTVIILSSGLEVIHFVRASLAPNRFGQCQRTNMSLLIAIIGDADGFLPHVYFSSFPSWKL